MEKDQVYVITGATSLISSGLLRRLVREGKKVYAVCRPGSEKLYRIPNSGRIEVIFCGLSELREADQRIGEKCDVFFHLGWDTMTREDLYQQNRNVAYTLDAVMLARNLGCHTFVGAGSQAEYGLANQKLTDETPCFPVTGYGMAKLCAGQMSRRLCRDLGIRHVWARILSVYGPMADEDTFVMGLVRKLMQRKPPKLTKGEQIWDFLHVDDCADALYLLSAYGKDGQVYPVGSGEAVPFKEYALQIGRIAAPGLSLCFGEIPYSDSTPMYLSADIEKLKQDVGFSPRIAFQTGITEMVMEMSEKWKT